MNHPPSLPRPGTVTLVGAGPGDPELLTLKAARAIAAASVLFVDDLVSDEIVALTPASARIVHVGKRGGCKSTPQAFIDKLMITAGWMRSSWCRHPRARRPTAIRSACGGESARMSSETSSS